MVSQRVWPLRSYMLGDGGPESGFHRESCWIFLFSTAGVSSGVPGDLGLFLSEVFWPTVGSGSGPVRIRGPVLDLSSDCSTVEIWMNKRRVIR